MAQERKIHGLHLSLGKRSQVLVSDMNLFLHAREVDGFRVTQPMYLPIAVTGWDMNVQMKEIRFTP